MCDYIFPLFNTSLRNQIFNLNSVKLHLRSVEKLFYYLFDLTEYIVINKLNLKITYILIFL